MLYPQKQLGLVMANGIRVYPKTIVSPKMQGKNRLTRVYCDFPPDLDVKGVVQDGRLYMTVDMKTSGEQVTLHRHPDPKTAEELAAQELH